MLWIIIWISESLFVFIKQSGVLFKECVIPKPSIVIKVKTNPLHPYMITCVIPHVTYNNVCSMSVHFLDILPVIKSSATMAHYVSWQSNLNWPIPLPTARNKQNRLMFWPQFLILSLCTCFLTIWTWYTDATHADYHIPLSDYEGWCIDISKYLDWIRLVMFARNR